MRKAIPGSSTSPRQYDLKVNNPWAVVVEANDESEDAPGLRLERRDRRRPVRGFTHRIKKGFSFCTPSGDGGLYYAKVKEYLPEAGGMIFYNVYCKREDEGGIWYLNKEDTFSCFIGDILPPFQYSLDIVDSREKTYCIPEHLQARFDKAVATLRSVDLPD